MRNLRSSRGWLGRTSPWCRLCTYRWSQRGAYFSYHTNLHKKSFIIQSLYLYIWFFIFNICELSFNRHLAYCWRAFDLSNKYYLLTYLLTYLLQVELWRGAHFPFHGRETRRWNTTNVYAAWRCDSRSTVTFPAYTKSYCTVAGAHVPESAAAGSNQTCDLLLRHRHC